MKEKGEKRREGEGKMGWMNMKGRGGKRSEWGSGMPGAP
jgi:hypothetical protein